MACPLVRVSLAARRLWISIRSLSQSLTASSAQLSDDSDGVPSQVSQVLSSATSPFSYRQLPSGLSRTDPMAPLSRKELQRYDAARDSGQKAAEFVSSRWRASHTGPSDIRAQYKTEKKPRGMSEESLCYLISKRRTSRALKMFNRLTEKGVNVSIESQNRLLDLLCYYGLGNTWVTARAGDEVSGWVETENEAKREKQVETLIEIEGSHVTSENLPAEESGGCRLWSGECAASKFFKEMSEKDVGTYEVLIAGMVRFDAFNEAMDVYRQMRRAGLQPSVGTYNILIGAVNKKTKNSLDVATELLSQMSEGDNPVKPNSQTLTVTVKALSLLVRENIDFVLQIWREITEAGVRPSLAGYTALLSFFVDNGQVGIIYTIVDHLERDPSPLHKITEESDSEFFRLASTAALELQDVSLAERLYALSLRGSAGIIGNPSGFFTKLLIIIARFGSASAFLRHYRQCVPSVFIPPDWAYSNFLLSCKHRGESAEATYLWNHAVRMRVNLSPGFVDRALQAVTSHVPPALDQDEVFRTTVAILECMDEMELTPTRNSMGGAVRLYTAVQPFQDVMEFVHKCVEKRWSLSYWSLCQLLEQCIRRRDVDSMLAVVRILVNDKYEVKQWHQQQIRRHMTLNAKEEHELKGLLQTQVRTLPIGHLPQSIDETDDHTRTMKLWSGSGIETQV